MKRLLRRAIAAIRRRARAFLDIPPNYVGDGGCLRAAASFCTWNQIPGDYLEFGVWRGHSFITAYRELTGQRSRHTQLGFDTPAYRQWSAEPPRFIAFDSFEGIPPGGKEERMVDYVAGSYACSEEEFLANIERAEVDRARVLTVRGRYDQTCNDATKRNLNLHRAAVVMIDCDLYESTVPVLAFITELVQQGTIIVFDDWFRFSGDPNSGEQRACREWLEANPQFELIEFWRQGPQSVAFLVNFRR